LDQNLAPRVGRELRDVYPDIRHLREVGLAGAEDGMVWQWAKERVYAIVSKDSDFWHRSVLFGSPPKVIWVRVGNCRTETIVELLRGEAVGIREFLEDGERRCLVLGR
jgi:predicted nuclease of predicted toxin-antitoxin system